MSELRPSCRLAAAALGCLVIAGCSMLRPDTRPTKPSAPASTPAASAAAHAPAAARQPAPAPEPAAAANWDPAVFHLDAAALVGQAWVFPSASPVRYGDNRFVFKRDRVEASNARDHATGTWTVEGDKLCVTLKAGAWGSACYVVTGSPAAGLQIRVLPDGERLPLRIE
jgi:hypothetical protein